MTFLRDVDFRIVNDLGFFVHQLSATLVPTQAGAPIVFDDPTSFEIDVHEGTVTLDNAKLTALFDTYIFGYRNAPLRKLAVSAGDGVIHLQGEMRRDGWVPFSLTGTLSIRDGSQLVFHPTGVRVSGINAQPVMRAANVKMADLLKIETPIAHLAGDDLVMSVDKLMPPPRLKITITALRVTPAGLDLTLDDGSHAGFALPPNASQQAMYIRGGDVKFMRSMPMNADILIGPVDSTTRDRNFVFDLYHYRDQVSAGYFNFDESGAMTIRMPSYAGPAGSAALGSAAARLNDRFLAAQQARCATRANTGKRPRWPRTHRRPACARSRCGAPRPPRSTNATYRTATRRSICTTSTSTCPGTSVSTSRISTSSSLRNGPAIRSISTIRISTTSAFSAERSSSRGRRCPRSSTTICSTTRRAR
jgi:hypothetical protein